MPRRLRSNRGLSAQQAHQALSVLLHDGKVRASEVWKALKRREHLLNDIRGRLAALGEDIKGIVAKNGPLPMAASATPTRKSQGRRKRHKPVSAARRASMREHGKYLSAVRTLSKADRAMVKAIRAKSGVRKAIAAAKRVATRGASGAAAHRRRVRSSLSNTKSKRGAQKALEPGDVQGTQPDYQSPKQRKLAEYQQRERPKPDKHGGSGAGRQQGGSSASRERG